jgi:K+-sensing histidine kinase KdpD
MLSVTAVLVLLIGAVNVINFISMDNELNQMLSMISNNGGTIPGFSDNKKQTPKKDRIFDAETQFSTRYFVLHYNSDGELLNYNLEHIAAVTEDDAYNYLEIAMKHGEGTGYKSSYIYRVTQIEEGRYEAIFLNCQNELNSMQTYAVASVSAGLGCILLVFALIWFFSKEAIDPTVRSMEKQKQFITDASHELKTPLTVISTCQKVLEMEVGQQKWIDKTLIQVDKMRSLVEELVTLSRLDEDKPPMQITRFDVSEAVEETALSFQDFAVEQGHELSLNIQPGLTFCGDQLSVRQLVSILLDNAVKYSTDNGMIQLKLESAKKGIQIKVSNQCQPMDKSELNKLFDRFYRSDKSRSRQTGGFGLGLSIANSITELHHGSIKATMPTENSIEFTANLTNQKPNKK